MTGENIMKEKIKLPQKGGAKKAAKIFEERKKQQPTDRLIKIISEIPEVTEDRPLKPTRVAKEPEL
jgi:hypothetical protein